MLFTGIAAADQYKKAEMGLPTRITTTSTSLLTPSRDTGRLWARAAPWSAAR